MRTLFGAAALALTLAAAPAYAATTFAQYKQLDGTDTIAFDAGVLSDNGGLTGSLVLFDFLDTLPPALDGDIEAYMNITATGDPYSGTISFLRVSDLANLLTVTFSGATLTGNGGSGAFFGSQPPGTVTYTSAFFDLSDATNNDFSLSFSGIDPGFSTTVSWTADSTGTFATDSGGPGNVIPEPGTWVMMIMGFGGVGALMRRRRQALAFA